MLYKLEVVEIDLEKVLVTWLSSDHGGVAPPLFSREGENSSRGTATPRAVHRPPMSGARVPTASLK
jgi:hypothetical protein